MPETKKSKSPYGQHSIDDVIALEAGNYVIQIGGELFSYNGKIAFSRERADKFFDEILEGLHDMKKNGSPEDQEDAVKALLLLKIHPLRIH